MKVSDNLFPKVQFDATAAVPPTPAAGTVVAYAKAEGALYYKGSDGVEHAFGGGSGGAGTVGYLNGINEQAGTAYTVATSDAGKQVRCTNAAAVALNLDTEANSGITAGFWCLFSQGGGGAVTATALAGVTLRAPNGAVTSAQYDARGLEYLGSDEWRVW